MQTVIGKHPSLLFWIIVIHPSSPLSPSHLPIPSFPISEENPSKPDFRSQKYILQFYSKDPGLLVLRQSKGQLSNSPNNLWLESIKLIFLTVAFPPERKQQTINVRRQKLQIIGQCTEG